MERIKKICKIFLIVIIILVLLALIFNKQIKKLKYEYDFRSGAKEVIKNYSYIDDISFSNDYSSLVEIKMKNDFNAVEYKEKEKTIKEITEQIEDLYTDFYVKILELEMRNECSICFYVENDKYEYKYGSIKKNDETYGEMEATIEEIITTLNNKNISYSEDIIKYLNGIDNIEQLKSILNLNEKEYIEEITYLSAIQSYNDGKFDETKEKLSKIEENYKETKEYSQKSDILSEAQGTWFADYSYSGESGIVIDGWDIHMYSFTINYEYTYQLDGTNKLVLSNTTDGEIVSNIILNNDNTLIYKYVDSGDEFKYIYNSDSTKFPVYEPKSPPKIGMTKTEAENSTWGKPTKINKTTTAYGTHEQWVYSENRYLYFDNGYLTSIQE